MLETKLYSPPQEFPPLVRSVTEITTYVNHLSNKPIYVCPAHLTIPADLWHSQVLESDELHIIEIGNDHLPCLVIGSNNHASLLYMLRTDGIDAHASVWATAHLDKEKRIVKITANNGEKYTLEKLAKQVIGIVPNEYRPQETVIADAYFTKVVGKDCITFYTATEEEAIENISWLRLRYPHMKRTDIINDVSRRFEPFTVTVELPGFSAEAENVSIRDIVGLHPQG